MKEEGREREEVQDIPLHTGLTADFQLLITLLRVRGGFSKKIFILGCRGSDCFGGFHSFDDNRLIPRTHTKCNILMIKTKNFMTMQACQHLNE